MKGPELLDSVQIEEVWNALGGAALRHGRGRAFWRNGDGWNVALDASRAVWFDFARGEGGGILRLVETVLGCDRREALCWLANHEGVELDNRPLSIAERREWQRKRGAAEAKAADLTGWREATLRDIRERRNDLISDDLTDCRWALHALKHGASENDWQFAWEVIAETLDIDRLDGWVIRLEAMAPAEVISLQQRMEARAA